MSKKTATPAKPVPAAARINAEDVAKLAGVSRSAVSRAFSTTSYIAPDTKARVLDAAKALGYQPNSLASGMARGRSNIVAVIINEVEAIRGPSIHSAILSALQATGRLPVVLTVSPEDDGQLTLQRHLTFPVDGLIVMSDSVSVAHVRAVMPHVRPVMLNFERMRKDVDTVEANDAPGIFEMVAHLEATGHRGLAFMAGRSTSISSEIRRTALDAALAKSALSLVGEVRGEFSYDQAFAAIEELLRARPRPDAIFCANDVMAFAVLDFLRLHTRISVPGDMAVIGFDDVIMARWPTYDLSTIRTDINALAKAVVALLEHQAANDALGRSLPTVAAQFVPRGSTRLKPLR